MQENQTDILTPESILADSVRRKTLLPIWIKVFAWIFLVLGAFVPIILAMALLGISAQQAIYGIETSRPLSPIGILITTIFAIKGLTAFGLLKEKDWAIKIGIADAIIGIAICIFLMVYPFINPGARFSFRLELVALIPYLLKLLKVRAQWEASVKI